MQQLEHDYREKLVDSRQGVNLTSSEAKDISAVVGLLLKQGLSPYQIVTAYPELGISKKTLYNCIEWGVLEIGSICSMDLRRQTSRRLPKKKEQVYKKSSRRG